MPGGYLDDEFQRLNLRTASTTLPDLPRDGGGTLSMVGQVISASSSIAVGKFLMVNPTQVLGPEVEGGDGTFTSQSAVAVPVLLLGPGMPSTGDYLICRFADHRWVAERTTPAGTKSTYILLPFCFCQVPATVQMTSADLNCNYKMFQSCRIEYQAVPASLAKLNLGSKVFLSTSTFYDPISASNFYYYLFCQYNAFYLTRVYPTSPYGSPYQDATLYTWYIGGYGNTCSPFHLDGGIPFSGSDASCNVTIDTL